MELTIRTLTPIWTGGAEARQVDRIHEAGILGSLRWWMEALVRGLGGRACDPTKPQCVLSGSRLEAYEQAIKNGKASRQALTEAEICDACQIFGATGWRRRFRLDIQDGTTPDRSVSGKIEVTRSHEDNKGTTQTSTWFFRDKPRSGRLSLRIQSLAPDFQPEVMAELVQFLADWAAIGARAQMGFGVIEVMNGRLDSKPLYQWLITTAGNNPYPTEPSLQNIFLARVHIPGATEQNTFDLKYDLRRLFSHDRDVRHFIMGTVHGTRMAAKIKISRPYRDGLMRVWGWIPEKAAVYRNSWNRDRVVQAIHDYLRTNYTVDVWREMSSERDSVTPNQSDAKAFLLSLLRL